MLSAVPPVAVPVAEAGMLVNAAVIPQPHPDVYREVI